MSASNPEATHAHWARNAAGRIATWLSLLGALWLVAGCTTLQQPLRGNLASSNAAVGACAAWYSALDDAVERAGVKDAGAARIAGYPYLRADRFLASFRERAAGDAALFAAWVDRLQALEVAGRRVELMNLPPAELATLGVVDVAAALARNAQCAAELRRADLVDDAQRRVLASRVEVPAAYLDWQRMLGMYALTRIPFGIGVARWHEDAAEMFRQARSGERAAPAVTRFVPASAARLSRDAVARLVARAARDSFGMPMLDGGEREMLLAAHAPVFEIETGGDYDRPGALVWRDGPAPAVDTARPVVYTRLAHTRHRGQTLLQLVYTVWFSERPHDGAFDLLAGRLDGLVWRVTLAPDGEPVVYDTIHPCGCFHMFFPTVRAQALPAPDPDDEWVFVPAALPEGAAGGRLVLRVATRTHYLVDVAVDREARGMPYAFADEDGLRALPHPDGGTRSAFGSDGLVPGTERGERYFFWPMGVPSAGAMRQWGSHATAFLGRRHFDDADLIERRFRLLPR